MPGACYHCGYEFDEKLKIAREDVCPSCDRDAHVCLNCLHYKKGVANDCVETNAEYLSVKDRRNFCDYFALREKSGENAPYTGRASLFKDDAPRKERPSLNDLFKKE